MFSEIIDTYGFGAFIGVITTAMLFGGIFTYIAERLLGGYDWKRSLAVAALYVLICAPVTLLINSILLALLVNCAVFAGVHFAIVPRLFKERTA